MDTVLSSSADRPTFVLLQIPQDMAEATLRVNITETRSGASLSVLIAVAGTFRMQVIGMLPSFGSSHQSFRIRLKNAGNLNLAI